MNPKEEEEEEYRSMVRTAVKDFDCGQLSLNLHFLRKRRF
jgi:hypothetical protein